MKKNKMFFGTLKNILLDIKAYELAISEGKYVDSNVPVATEAELKFAKYLVEYIRKGGYLKRGVIAENAKRCLKIFNGESASELVRLTGLTERQLYSVNRLVEESLESRFPKPLRTLWYSKEFEIILTHIKSQDSVYKSVNEHLTAEKALLDSIISRGKLRSNISVPELKEQLPYLGVDFTVSVAKGLNVIDAICSMIDENEEHLYNLVKLIKITELNLPMSAELYRELTYEDRLGIFSEKGDEG